MENAGLDQRINQDIITQGMGFINNEVKKYQRIRINSNIKDLDRPMIKNQILELSRKYEAILKDGIFEVFIRTQSKGVENQKVFYTRILIFTSKERFDVSVEHRHIKLSFFKALYKLEAQLTKKNLTMRCGPKRYPYNFSHNITSKELTHKIIMKRTQNVGVAVEN